ncbi:MAG: response regulator [Planctomycetes bacterium]|nr:response regulator [Planctomycetota bacterium]
MIDKVKRKEKTVYETIKGCQQSYSNIRKPKAPCHKERVSVTEDLDHMAEERDVMKDKNLESLGILAGGIAHDFNNLLTIISGNMSLIKMQVDPGGEIARRLAEMEKTFLRARTLTQQLLTFSTGGEPVKSIISLSGLMRDSARFSIGGTDIRCEFNIPNEPFSVEVDTEQIGLAINNLMINAVQALPEGGNIKVMVENVILGPGNILPLPEGKYVKATVEDYGIGISAEHMQKVFDPYFTTKDINSGLGLSTTYSIIKRHGGYITVVSKKGVGATFSLYLPALQQGSSSISNVKEAGGRVKDTTIVGKKILVMDDKETIRDVVKEMLIYLSCEVNVASDGEEAITLYTKEKESGKPFDAVIVDLTIPDGMDGQETVKILRKIDPNVKAIVSSGYSNDPVMANFKKYGFTAVLPKPYRIDDLNKILLNALVDTDR